MRGEGRGRDGGRREVEGGRMLSVWYIMVNLFRLRGYEVLALLSPPPLMITQSRDTSYIHLLRASTCTCTYTLIVIKCKCVVGVRVYV